MLSWSQMPADGAIAMAKLLLSPYSPMPSLRRDDGSTSMAQVLFDTVTAPKGAPCNVRQMANISMVPAAM